MRIAKKTLFVVGITLALFLGGLFAAIKLELIPTVAALECQKYGSVCGFKDWDKKPKPCNQGDPGAEYLCCFWSNYPGTKCESVKKSKCACGNSYYVCGGGSEETPTPPPCSCTSITCNDQPPTKWRRTPNYSNGQYRTCNGGNDCNPSTGNCGPKYENSAPTCSISPATVSGVRGSGGTAFTITASDLDYGDEVRITGFEVKDSAGNLNNCVTLQTAGGGRGLGATVKQGYPDGNPQTSQSNTFIANPDLMHGIFVNVNGQSVCSGRLTVEVRDVKGDSLDTVSYASCSVNINMRNNVPTISDITVTDQDNMPSLRKVGNLINGNPLFVGSVLESKRASYCSAALSLSQLGQCNGANRVALMTRKNPFQVEFTVTDTDGVKDIMQAGLWIQRADLSATTRALPLTSNGVRNSIQVLYSEKENVTDSTNTRWYFVSKACVGNTCSPNTIINSPKQIFSAYSLITSQGAYLGNNGNVSRSPYQSSTFRQWQKVSFPDCYLTVAGCTVADNVPAASLNAANGNQGAFANYDWSIAADENHLICYKNTGAAVEVRANSGVCPTDCAACAQKAGVTQVGANQATFKFKIFFNDRDGAGSGMDAGLYKIFVQASDKVGVPLHNVTGLGDEGWLKFDRNGAICTAGNCAAGDFALNYDPIPPTVANIMPHVENDNTVNVSMTYSDNNGGAKIAGESFMYLIREELVDGEPSERAWMKKIDGITDYTGANEYRAITGAPQLTTVTHTGTGIQAGEGVVAGSCAYDLAGNMGCATNGVSYVFISSWLKSSLGDIYSNTSSSGYAFKNLTVPNTPDSTSQSLYAPFSFTGNSAATGVVMSGGGIGIAGGKPFGSIDYPLGFSTTSTAPQEYYRTTDTGTMGQGVFNMLNFQSNLVGHEYERMKALATKNCELLSVQTPGVCKTIGTTIADTADASAKIKIIAITTNQPTITQNLTCTNSSIIFVSPGINVTLSGQVRKLNAQSGCMFVLGDSSSLTIEDVTADNAVGKPNVDLFEAGVIASQNAKFTVAKGPKGAVTKRYDRLEIKGFIYSANIEPVFKRILPSVDNKRYPAEWLIYDANVLDSFRNVLGLEKTVDLVCGTSNHILCGEK